MNNFFKKNKIDILVISIIFLLAIISMLIINVSKEKGKYIVVTYDNKQMQIYPIDSNVEVKLSYKENSYNILVIKDGSAYIKDASCRDLICVKTKKINRSGETIICLPNKLVVKVVSNIDDIDAVTK